MSNTHLTVKYDALCKSPCSLINKWLLKCWWTSKRMYFHCHICSVWPLYHIHTCLMCIYLISTPQLLILNACFISHLVVECYWIQLTDEFTYIEKKNNRTLGSYNLDMIVDRSWTGTCKAYYHLLKWYKPISQSICKSHEIWLFHHGLVRQNNHSQCFSLFLVHTQLSSHSKAVLLMWAEALWT